LIRNALIVGGGIAGMTAAIALRRAGCAVDLIDLDSQWRVYGAGISLTGLSLRAFDALGLLQEIRSRGYVSTGMRGRDASGRVVMESPVPENPAPIQQGGGILRPVLHDILSSAVRREGIQVELGVGVASFNQDADGVTATLTTGRTSRYELVVGADGIHSELRAKLFPAAPKPRFTGQGCWRVVALRLADVNRTEMFFGGPVRLGVNPVSQQQMYLFVLEHVPDNPFYTADQRLVHVRELLAPFAGCIPAVRESLTDPEQVIYRPLEWLLLPDPWFVGRVLLIGDAAHATTPHLASGAGIATEDGLVLAEELQRNGDVPQALRAFMLRRYARTRLVVEASVRIGECQMARDEQGANAEMGAAFGHMQAPY
jgi:2-polyprenyl-6-methoxyphenol hydroxylase-like FAD-dependent oxidoreductase